MIASCYAGRSEWARVVVLAVALLGSGAGIIGPAAAQAPGDILERLRSLPPQAQTTAVQRYLYFYEQRAYPNQSIPAGAMERARIDHERQFGPLRPPQPQSANPYFNQNQWSSIGPAPAGSYSGRINSIVVHPTDPNSVFIGAATGGVWKTSNGGTNWSPLTDTQCSTAMGSIAIDPSNPNIIYAGTGEANFSADSYYGCGVLKSTDGGGSWTQLGASVFDTTTGGASIAKLVIHPTNTQTILVASSFGLYRSTDGGANFTQVLAGTATDVVFDPSNPNIAYAALGNIFGNASNGVYQSTDAGASFPTKLTTGFAGSNVGRISLGLAASAPQTIYAAVQNSSTFALLGIWKTTNASSWSQISATGASCASQCWYDIYLAVDPTNANTVYFGGFSVFKSTDGGSNFSDIGSSIHVDQHAFAFQPGNASVIYAGNDGGVYKSSNGGANWTSLNTNLSITQFYAGLSLHPSDSNIALGGTQDNHTVRYSGSPGWTAVPFSGVGGCDGGFTVIDQATPTTQYAECQWEAGQSYSGPRRSDNGGSFVVKTNGITTSESALFVPPLVGSPSTATTLYFGTVRVYKTTDRGDTWTGSSTTIVSGSRAGVTAIAQAPSDANVIYAAGNNGAGVFKSTDGNSTYNAVNTGLPNRVPTYLAVHPTSPNTAFVVYSGFGGGHVYKTTNGGTNWTDISGNLPDIPVNAIVLDALFPANEIWVGTDLGVYRTTNGGTDWNVYNFGLPNVPVLDLKYSAGTGILAAATHGRGVFYASIGGAKRTATHDFDGNGKSDIAWREVGGTPAVWLMNSAQVVQSATFGVVPNSWLLVSQRDFNGDGKYDWLWRDSSGAVALWFFDGTLVPATANLGVIGTNWTIVGTGDFNGDRKGDILWRENGGTIAIWLMNGSVVLQSAALGTVGSSWSVAGTGDFNGDGNRDILWRDSGGAVAIWFLNGTRVISTAIIGTVGTNWVISQTGDFNADGRWDILWRDNNTNTYAVWLMDGSQVVSSALLGSVSAGWVASLTGDFNGDQRSDILWRNDNTGDVAIWFLNGTQVTSSSLLGTVATSWIIQSMNAD
ncbi:MAG: FG-GAP-like repeat-containing protein [Xanthobacteraceae bacterium]